MIQIRNVPPDLHERLKQHRFERDDLSDYLTGELDRIASIPAIAETFAEIEMDRKAGRLLTISSEETDRRIREDRASH